MNDWSRAVTLEGRHVVLRPMTTADRDPLLGVFEELGPVFTTLVPTAETIDDWLARLLAEQAAGRALPFTVLDAAGRVSGATRYLRMAPAHRRLEIGGTLYAPRVQRTGLNTEAKHLLLRHAFDVLGCHVVQLRTDWLNQRSRRAIERLGARCDGVLRGHLTMRDGRVRDTVVYSIVAGEWPGVRAQLASLMARDGDDG